MTGLAELGRGATIAMVIGSAIPALAAAAEVDDPEVVIEIDPPPLAPAPTAVPSVPAARNAQADSYPAASHAPPEAATARIDQHTSARAEIPPQVDIPGVLTRKGTLVVEPAIEYSHTDVNQFSFGGVAILDTVLVGAIEANQSNRDAVTATLGLRYGITNRLEGEIRIPAMYRNDKTTNTFVNSSNAAQTTSIESIGLGDIEASLHYQINDGLGKWPVFVANFRAKSPTGEGPYDVDRNSLGVEEELATGSGFWGFEPSLTVIAPSDPAVFYASLGYLWNVTQDVDKVIGSRRVTEVDPGDAVRFSAGMGLALNEKISFSVGYQHDWIMKTTASFADGDVSSDALSVGTLTLGVNWQISDNTALNTSVGIGVTNDAPDVRLMARVPIAIDLLK